MKNKTINEVKTRREYLVFGSPCIEQPEIDEVVASLKSGWIGTGHKVGQFEKLFANYKGSRSAVALNSCTAALHLSMLALKIQPGDEVLVPSMTFAATANAVIHAGGRPVLVDCCRDTMNIDPVDIERKITPRTKVIIPVHFAGRACDMQAIMHLAQKYNLKVIEDCAHAIETEYRGQKAGTFGDMGCFSFYVTKNIVTGEGGMVITENEDYAHDIKIFALHGMSSDAWKRFSDAGYKHYQVVFAGFKYNMTDMQAALGLHQLGRVDTYWQRRQEIWQTYDRAFADLPLGRPPAMEPQTRHAYHLYTLMLDEENAGISRDQFISEMNRRKIGVGVHYIALHLHPFYQYKYHYTPGDFPNAEWISQRTVSIPLSAKLSDEDVADVIQAVRDIILRERKQA